MYASVRRRVAVGVAGLAAVVAAGCGGSSAGTTAASSDQTPKTELVNSVRNLGSSDTLAMTLNLDVSKADLTAIAQAGGTKVTANDQRLIGALAGGVIRVEVKGDKPLSQYKAGDKQHPDVSMSVEVDNSPIIEIRSVAQTLYARADVQKILQLADEPQSKISELQSQLPANLPFLQDALQGKWLSLDEQQAQSLLEGLGGGTATANPQQQQQLLDKLQAVLDKDVQVTRTGTDKGDQLTLTGNLRTLATDLLTSLESVVPGASTFASDLSPTDVPNKDATAVAVVSDNKLQSLTVDLAQFAQGQDKAQLAGKKIPLQLTFSDSGGDIKAPSGATKVDLLKLIGILGSSGSGSSSGSTSG